VPPPQHDRCHRLAGSQRFPAIRVTAGLELLEIVTFDEHRSRAHCLFRPIGEQQQDVEIEVAALRHLPLTIDRDQVAIPQRHDVKRRSSGQCVRFVAEQAVGIRIGHHDPVAGVDDDDGRIDANEYLRQQFLGSELQIAGFQDLSDVPPQYDEASARGGPFRGGRHHVQSKDKRAAVSPQ